MMNPAVESLSRRFKVCKVNLDTNQPLAAKFRVEAVPTLLIFKGGQVVKRYQGVTPEETLRTDLEALTLSEPEA